MTDKSYRLLIIDDDELDIRLIHEHLKKSQLSYEFKEAQNLKSALDYLMSEQFDCVLLDYRLPDGEALERFHELVAVAHKKTAFILLTGMDDEKTHLQALAIGLQNSLKKNELSRDLLTQAIRLAVKIKESEQETIHLKTSFPSSKKTLKILNVDDNLISLKTLHRILEPFGKVINAENGDQAIELFKKNMDEQNPFDLVCLDIIMPHKSGIEALKEIRQLEQNTKSPNHNFTSTKIILTTTLEESLDNLSIPKELFYDGYIQKPITKEKISDEMKRLGLFNANEIKIINKIQHP